MQGEIVKEDDPHWIDGITWLPETCLTAGTVDQCDDTDTKVLGTFNAVQTWRAYVNWSGAKCTTLDYFGIDFQSISVRALLAAESRLIGVELWEGAKARAKGYENDWFTKFNTVTGLSLAHQVTAGATDPFVSLQMLEQYLANNNNGARGMIHAPRDLVSNWAFHRQIFWRDGELVTVNDNIVVPDAGYTGSGPAVDANQAPVARTSGSCWAYATSIVQVRREAEIFLIPDNISQAISVNAQLSKNLIEYRAERAALASWDSRCVLGAAQTNIQQGA